MTVQDLMHAKEVASLFGVTERTAERWGARGIMGGRKIGGGYRFPRADVFAVIPTKPTKPTSTALSHIKHRTGTL